MTTQLPMLNLTVTVRSEILEIFAEASAELNQDRTRESFSNLGAGDNTRQESTTDQTNNFINAQAGDDWVRLFGGTNDVVFLGSGDDYVFAGNGDDELHGGSGDDELIGFYGDDKLFGGSGADFLDGGFGFDQLKGGTGRDTLFGGAGADILEGGSGNDHLFGDHDGSATSEQGRDTLIGGFGDDLLSGGGGADVLFGGAGADWFVVNHANDLSFGHSDVIRDFSRAEGDTISLLGIDAHPGVTGHQQLTFSESGPSLLRGVFWFGEVNADQMQTVFINLDGGAPDLSFQVKLLDPGMSSLLVSDFVGFIA